jgi:hypothetical protein
LHLQLDQHCLSTIEPLPTPACSAAAETAAASTTETAETASAETTSVPAESSAVNGSRTKRSEYTAATLFSGRRNCDEQNDETEEQDDAEN